MGIVSEPVRLRVDMAAGKMFDAESGRELPGIKSIESIDGGVRVVIDGTHVMMGRSFDRETVKHEGPTHYSLQRLWPSGEVVLDLHQSAPGHVELMGYTVFAGMESGIPFYDQQVDIPESVLEMCGV